MFAVLRPGARLLCVWALLVPGAIFAHDLFVGPDGTSSGPGTRERPYDLATAFSGQVGQPGDTFWLMEGSYAIGHIDTKIEGAPGQPVTFRPWPGERARVDGSLTFFDSAGFVVLRDFELFSSDTNRLSAQTNVGFNPTDISIIPGIASYVPNMSFINLVVHDQTRHGFYLSEQSSNNVIYGCIVFNNGWWSPDNAEGHGLYVQGHGGIREATENIVFNNSGIGFHVYENHGGDQSYLDGIILDGNVGFSSGAIQNVRKYADWIIGVDEPAVGADQIVVKNNMGYDTQASAGWSQLEIGRDGTNGTVAVVNNYFPQGMTMKNWTRATVAGNVFGTGTTNLVVNLDQTLVPLTAVWNGNTYFVSGTGNGFMYNSNNLDLSGWQNETGFDKNSTTSVGTISGTKVFIRTNRYEPGRANIVVYNWDGLSNVMVDVSSALTPGAPYELRNAEDFFAAPVLSGIYDGQPLNLPMTGLTVASPNGPMLTPPPTGPTFNVFVLLPIVACIEVNSVNGAVELSWRTNAVDWVLQTTSNALSASQWTDVTNTPVLNGGRMVVSITPDGASGFYRLRPSVVRLQAPALVKQRLNVEHR